MSRPTGVSFKREFNHDMGASMGLIWGLLVLVLATGVASIYVFAA